ncbi:Exocyst complex component SEC5A [Diplonema papillatum]|nr:Exocyst complex component SEC5A [Diplonema papillatum]
MRNPDTPPFALLDVGMRDRKTSDVWRDLGCGQRAVDVVLELQLEYVVPGHAFGPEAACLLESRFGPLKEWLYVAESLEGWRSRVQFVSLGELLLRELRTEFVCAREGFSRKEFEMRLQLESEDALDRAVAELWWERRKSDDGAPPSEQRLRRRRRRIPPAIVRGGEGTGSELAYISKSKLSSDDRGGEGGEVGKGEMSRRHVRGEENTDTQSGGFDAQACINASMRDRSLAELQRELGHVEEQQRREVEERRKMVATHLTTFIACKDIVEKLHTSDVKLMHNSTLKNCCGVLASVEQRCSDSFKGLLERDGVLVDLKQASQVFDKFQFLLSIPENIRKNIQLHEYQTVIFDYHRAQHYEKALKHDHKRQTAKLFAGVFIEVNEAVGRLRVELLQKLKSMNVTDVAQAEALLSVLRKIDTPDLVLEYVNAVKSRFHVELNKVANTLKTAIQNYQSELQKAMDQDQAMRQLISARSMSNMRMRSNSLAILRGSGKNDQDLNQSFVRGRDLLDELRNVSDSCALAEMLGFVKDAGHLLAKHLLSFWQVYHRQWDEPGGAPQRGDEITQLFTECCAEFEKYAWPCVEHLQPSSTSGASLRDWRGALLLVVKPANHILAATDPKYCPVLVALRAKCQENFVQQSCGRLTAEVASWATLVEWKIGHRVSKIYPSTHLPLKFEAAITELLHLWNSTDELRKDAAQLIDLSERVFQAHQDFTDLLHYLAFNYKEPNPKPSHNAAVSPLAHYLQGATRDSSAPSKEDRLLMVWTDCLTLELVVSGNTYSTFKKKIAVGHDRGSSGYSVEGAPLDGPFSTTNGRDSMKLESTATQLMSLVASPLTPGTPSPRGECNGGGEEDLSDLATLRSNVKALKERIVMEVVAGRMERIARIISINGFLRADINWSYCADPVRLRDYCHDVLLCFVEIHEASVRLTKGYATRSIMTAIFNQTMGVFLHSVKQLDFLNCTELMSANATLQLELELEFLASCMAGFRSNKWQVYQSQAMEYLAQFYVNTNKESERRKKARDKVSIDAHRTKVMIDSLKHDPVP